jgi:hypothetical protein
MIDWEARALAILDKTPQTPNAKTDETRVLSVSSVPVGRCCTNSRGPADGGGANQWDLYFIDRDPLTVAFAPALTHDQVLARYTAAVAAVEVATTIPTCTLCRHVTRFGNCSEPVRAGLTDTFGLVVHPDGGKDCVAFDGEGDDPAPAAARS